MRQKLPINLWKIIDQETYSYIQNQLLVENVKPCCNLQNLELWNPNCIEQWIYKPEDKQIIFQGFKPFCDAHATRKKYEILNFNKWKNMILTIDIMVPLNVMDTIDVDPKIFIKATSKITKYHIKMIKKEIKLLSNTNYNREAMRRLEQVSRAILFLLKIDQPTLVELEEYYWFLLTSAVKLENSLSINDTLKMRPIDKNLEEIYCGLAQRKNQIYINTESTLQNVELKKNKLKLSQNYLAKKSFSNRRR